MVISLKWYFWVLLGFFLLIAMGGVAEADVMINWATVGDAGNVADTRYETPGYGAVPYVYDISRCEVTNGQYVEFLNCVAADDPHGLYNVNMTQGWGGILRSGDSGGYVYATIEGRADMPVNYVSWYDTLRFANWLHNGQGTADTEDGAYDMSLGPNVVRKPDALIFLPTEDEWYKAAYYKGGGTDTGYWSLPTQSNISPTAEFPPGTDMTNGSANWNMVVGDLTDVGAYVAKPSNSPYGTFDQGGNVWEWNEEVLNGLYRGIRGGALNSSVGRMHASFGYCTYSDSEHSTVGFRVAQIPEPTTLFLFALGLVSILRRV